MEKTHIAIEMLDDGFVTEIDSKKKAHKDWPAMEEFIKSALKKKAHKDWPAMEEFIKSALMTFHVQGIMESPGDILRITITSDLNPPQPANP